MHYVDKIMIRFELVVHCFVNLKNASIHFTVTFTLQ